MDLPCRTVAIELCGERVPVAFWDCGPRDARALVLVHGFISSRRQWRLCLDRLVGRGYRVVAPDLPGFGDSGMLSRPHVLSDYGQAVCQLVQALGLDQPVLVGHSFGGMVAVRAAEAHPERFSALVLVASAGMPDPRHRFPAWMRLRPLRRTLIWLVTGRLVGRWYFRRLVARVEAVAPQVLADLQWGVRRAREVLRMDDFYRDGEFGRCLGRIPLPTLLVWGREDHVVPPEHADRIAAALCDARLVWIDDCDHLPMLERPEAFVDVVDGFVRQAVGAGVGAGVGLV